MPSGILRTESPHFSFVSWEELTLTVNFLNKKINKKPKLKAKHHLDNYVIVNQMRNHITAHA